jgi:heme exporter protein CcmD
MLEFGKYAIYIWACYGISALVLGGLVLYTFAARPKDLSPETKPDNDARS